MAAVVPAVVPAAAVAAVVPAVRLREHALPELYILRHIHSLLVLHMVNSDLADKLEAGIGFLHENIFDTIIIINILNISEALSLAKINHFSKAEVSAPV